MQESGRNGSRLFKKKDREKSNDEILKYKGHNEKYRKTCEMNLFSLRLSFYNGNFTVAS